MVYVYFIDNLLEHYLLNQAKLTYDISELWKTRSKIQKLLHSRFDIIEFTSAIKQKSAHSNCVLVLGHIFDQKLYPSFWSPFTEVLAMISYLALYYTFKLCNCMK